MLYRSLVWSCVLDPGRVSHVRKFFSESKLHLRFEIRLRRRRLLTRQIPPSSSQSKFTIPNSNSDPTASIGNLCVGEHHSFVGNAQQEYVRSRSKRSDGMWSKLIGRVYQLVVMGVLSAL